VVLPLPGTGDWSLAYLTTVNATVVHGPRWRVPILPLAQSEDAPIAGFSGAAVFEACVLLNRRPG
jgi:hypothetical protein